MPKYVEITEDEAWAIDHTIRHTYNDGPNNIGKDLLTKVMHTVLEFEERRGKPFAPEVMPLALTEEECWAIDHQIRCDLTVNNKPVGRSLLLKVFRALTEFANERDSEGGLEHLGNLADLLRAPAEESLPPGDSGSTSPGSAGDSKNSGRRAPDRRPNSDEGTPGALPRDK